MKIETSFAAWLLISLICGDLVQLAKGKLMSKSKPNANADQTKAIRKMQLLASFMEAAGGAAPLTLMDYHSLVFETPRNYTVFVLFYNNDNICNSCPPILQAFNRIATSFWNGFSRYNDLTHERILQIPLFFVTINMYTEGYRQMLVDLDPSKPGLYVFSPSRSSKYNEFENAPHQLTTLLDFGRYDMERMLMWVQEKAGIFIPIENEKQESNSNAYFVLTAMALVGTLVLFNMHLFGHLESVLEAVGKINFSYAIAVMVIWLTSGQMFNFMRQTPFMSSSFIYPGSRYQYGMESVIIMIIYAAMLYAIIHLVETRERQLEEHLPDEAVQFQVFAGLSGLFFAYAMLQSIIHTKTG